jgi:hypothetical protein
MAANLFEAAESIGVRREELTVPLGLDARVLVDPRRGIDWDTLVALLERLSEIVGDDVELLRKVGWEMAGVPSGASLLASATQRSVAERRSPSPSRASTGSGRSSASCSPSRASTTTRSALSMPSA